MGIKSEVPFHPCSLAPPFSSTKEFPVGWGPLAGLPWIPPHARALPGSTNFLGTNAQAHLLVMSLNVANCNLGKVNLEAMLVSCFPNYSRGSPMPLAGHLVTYICSCLLAVLRKVLLQLLAVCVPVCALVFPIPPSLLVWAR